jgi:hypothetical protein
MDYSLPVGGFSPSRAKKPPTKEESTMLPQTNSICERQLGTFRHQTCSHLW